jgi:hypothetical protein
MRVDGSALQPPGARGLFVELEPLRPSVQSLHYRLTWFKGGGGEMLPRPASGDVEMKPTHGSALAGAQLPPGSTFDSHVSNRRQEGDGEGEGEGEGKRRGLAHADSLALQVGEEKVVRRMTPMKDMTMTPPHLVKVACPSSPQNVWVLL